MRVIEINYPYACAIKIKHQFFDTWLAVWHIPREIPSHCYFFIEGGNFTGHLISKLTKYFRFILVVLLLLTFSVKRERVFKLIKSFVRDLYDYAYTEEQAEKKDEESGDDKEIDIKLQERRTQQMKITKMLLK